MRCIRNCGTGLGEGNSRVRDLRHWGKMSLFPDLSLKHWSKDAQDPRLRHRAGQGERGRGKAKGRVRDPRHKAGGGDQGPRSVALGEGEQSAASRWFAR